MWQGLKKSVVPIYNSKLQSVKNKPDWNSLLKFIFVYDIPSDVGLGREAFITSKCPVSSCYITNNPMLRRVSHIFFLQDTMQVPARKPKGQIWLSRILESPINSFVPSGVKTYLNWTATYRWDSTIVTPYAKFVSNSDIKNSARNHTLIKKRHLVAWFASNCMTDNDRYGYVNELKQYIPVDVYGQCGDLHCSRSDEKSCFQILSDKYKFYLSFENSNCDYYITEKLFLNALSNNVVPVVMGARKEDYLKSAPPNSFISVEDFPDAKSLANYLLYLDGNEEMYNKYLAWKGSGQFINTKFWCRVCALVQDDDRPNMWYEGFSDWWSHPGACRQGRWEEKGESGVVS
ncbi:hypothetical protein HELRODRAFT_84937 [Helobdella robusta]|uniref:Fucosyltransferase n=1 Tax=Helobdella robusta TaxID=6412 RepID=T1G5Q5_HELRO|nr:hypothetical protein HELRODRAFT_84937 [Helobdella robusta]ESN98146.1 hypothetical protein HELRODRAFT_84937 [Helobdella robusta]